jgi:hypothetical protein
MVNFTVNVVSENEDKRIPVEVAGSMMIDIQHLLVHVGEYLMAKELRVQETLDPKLSEKFMMFIDSSGGISLNTSSYTPETKGYGNIVDDAVTLMEKTLDALGAGTGGYWMEDNFTDAICRNQVIYDVVKIQDDLGNNDGYALMYGSSDNLKKFGKVNIDKLANFVESRGLTANGATLGLIVKTTTKSKGDVLSLASGDADIKLSFANEDAKAEAQKYVDAGPIVIAGKLAYSNEGRLVSIENAGGVTPIDSIKFRRMISSTGDVELKAPVEGKLAYRNGKWHLYNDDLGIDVSKPTWDETVQQFHDYFIFIWTEYATKDDALMSDEEKDIKQCLIGLVA